MRIGMHLCGTTVGNHEFPRARLAANGKVSKTLDRLRSWLAAKMSGSKTYESRAVEMTGPGY